MSPTILRAADRVASPWKNGGGVTREIAVEPAGVGMDDFDWRISMAEVHEAGPFSTFPGVDRNLSVIDGRLGLTFEDGVRELDAESAPLAFPGDHACHGEPVGGPVHDLNVMVRRGRFTAEVERITNADWRPSGEVALLLALEPLVTLGLQRFDALLWESTAILTVDGRAIGIRLNRL